jgi:anaerobic magnesium-protoporphyrin IX monomethyl ester cyclase
MKLVLYNPPSNATRKPVLPMSLLALGAVLEGTHEYRIVDGNLEADPLAALTVAIRALDARVLGVTVMPGPQLFDAVPTCRALKVRFPQLTIVWGGYFPTQHYEPCLRSDFVDVVVRGHGELAFKAWLDTFERGEEWRAIPGLAYRKSPTSSTAAGTLLQLGSSEEGSEAVTTPLPPIPHPDRLPGFPYHRLDLGRYVRSTFLGRRTLAHHSSYGCPFFCSFCAVVNMVNGRWLAQSAERTARTVRWLAEEWQVDAVEFYDNNFFVQEARTREFAERIKDLGISWWGEARIDTMLKYPDRTWELMRASGLKMVFLGAESGSDETLKRMNKGGTASTAKTLEIAEKMRRYGIIPEFSFVLGNPPDPVGDARQTVEFIRRVKRTNPSAEIILYTYTPVPLAGELYDQAKASGFQFPETLDEWINPRWQEFAQRRNIHVPWVKDPLRAELHDFERVLNAYYPTATNPNLSGWRRQALRAASAWRYHLRLYHYPIELRALHRLLGYQRPETSGF